MTPKLLNDCFLHDKDRLTHNEAIAILKERVSPVVTTIDIPLENAGNRIAAETIRAVRPIPAHSNAAVDGYAFSSDYYDTEHGSNFKETARITAGNTPKGTPEVSSCARIFTGAVIPEIYDCIVMQEDVSTETINGENNIFVPPGLKPGANRRLAGEDVKEGETIVKPGTYLRPQELAAIASAGRSHVKCYQPVRVAFFSTGDEVIRPGEEFRHGQVYDANAPMLKALTESTGTECTDLGILPDNRDQVRKRLLEASQNYNMLLTSGGASRGDEDHVVEALNELGNLHMWQIAIKPGRPMSFGQINNCVFAGLPGNPVAVFVCFLLYVRPILIRLSGGHWPEPRRYPLRSASRIERKKSGRREYWRATTIEDETEGLKVCKFPRDGSGLITSLRAADGLVEIDEDITQVSEGDLLKFIPFTELGLKGA